MKTNEKVAMHFIACIHSKSHVSMHVIPCSQPKLHVNMHVIMRIPTKHFVSMNSNKRMSQINAGVKGMAKLRVCA